MTFEQNAPSSATHSLAQNSAECALISVHRDAILVAAELIEESLRAQFGWQYKSSQPIELARLLHKASARPNIEFPGLGDLLTAHDTLSALANTQPFVDRSPEGIAIRKLAATFSWTRPARGWDHRYRRVDLGEVIQAGDECLTDSHLGWQPAERTVGQTAPDPAYTSHRIYRHLKVEEAR